MYNSFISSSVKQTNYYFVAAAAAAVVVEVGKKVAVAVVETEEALQTWNCFAEEQSCYRWEGSLLRQTGFVAEPAVEKEQKEPHCHFLSSHHCNPTLEHT